MMPHVSHSSAAPEPAGRRIRLVAVHVTEATDGTGRVDVELDRPDGGTVVGTAAIDLSATGALKAAASATLHALQNATAAAHAIALGGVKTVRAFDETVVLVQLVRTNDDGPVRLVGAAVADQGLVRAAVVAVLTATNRVLSGPGAT